MAIVGHAGTVNTGATDDLDALADVSARQGVWLHVDGAFGAWAALSPALRPRLAGLERADSVAFDLHKWMYMPYDVGAVLIRDPEIHRDAFRTGAAGYIGRNERGAEADEYRFNELGPQLSRSFRALKVWLSLKAYGADAYRRQIEQNVAQARYFAALIDAHPDLELLAPAPLNVVCFRYRPRALATEEAQDSSGTPDLERLNREILMRVHEEGVAVPTSARVAGKFGLRCAITNHRSRREDFALLVDRVVSLGDELWSGGVEAASSESVSPTT
jgi:glutamate/tyrosine decarboxylase-like PLP-dependent enzyme